MSSKKPLTKTCRNCKGMGYIIVSDCCGAEAYSNGDASSEDYGICPECHEHCTYVKEDCETCNGTGEIEFNEEQAKEDAYEWKYDQSEEDKLNK